MLARPGFGTRLIGQTSPIFLSFLDWSLVAYCLPQVFSGQGSTRKTFAYYKRRWWRTQLLLLLLQDTNCRLYIARGAHRIFPSANWLPTERLQLRTQICAGRPEIACARIAEHSQKAKFHEFWSREKERYVRPCHKATFEP